MLGSLTIRQMMDIGLEETRVMHFLPRLSLPHCSSSGGPPGLKGLNKAVVGSKWLSPYLTSRQSYSETIPILMMQPKKAKIAFVYDLCSNVSHTADLGTKPGPLNWDPPQLKLHFHS